MHTTRPTRPSCSLACSAMIVARQAHRDPAVLVHRLDKLLVHLAGKHRAHHFHGRIGGHALAVDELHGHIEALHGLGDSEPAAVHDHRVHADNLQKHDVSHDLGAQLLVDHGRSAVLDDDGLTGDVLDPRHRLGEHFACDGVDPVRSAVLIVVHGN